jgi:hypothetical protein
LCRLGDEVKRKFAILTAGNRLVWVSDSLWPNKNGDTADRRDFTKTAAGLLVPPELIARIAAATRRSGPVDTALVADHEQLADALARRHRTTQPEVLVGQVTRQADVLLGLLDRPMGVTDRWRLEAITVGSHAQAGILAFNIGDRLTARRYFALAKGIADDARNDTLYAQTFALARALDSQILTGECGGDNRKAVGLMRRAVDHARRADPVTRAYTHRLLGLELAAAGDERGFCGSFDAAEQHSSQHAKLDGHGFFPYYLSQAPWAAAGDRGIGLVLIGRPAEALDALTDALVPSDPRWTVIVLAETAAARIHQDEPEQACQ